MRTLLSDLEPGLAEVDGTWWRETVSRAARDGATAVANSLPALPRRIGRHGRWRGIHKSGDARTELSAWRACDVAAWALFDAARLDDAALLDLYAHGDIEERQMVMRVASIRPLGPAVARLLGEAQRSNTQPHFEALVCDGDLVARACGRLPEFGIDQLNRVMLKAAFLGIRLMRIYDVDRHANLELSRMLQDLATEREAAGRPVWPDTSYLVGRAPVGGSVARLLGELEHGDDERRLAGVRGLSYLGRKDLTPFLSDRLAREPKPQIRAALQEALRTLA